MTWSENNMVPPHNATQHNATQFNTTQDNLEENAEYYIYIYVFLCVCDRNQLYKDSDERYLSVHEAASRITFLHTILLHCL